MAARACFADPNISVEADYQPPGAAPVQLRAILSAPTDPIVGAFGGKSNTAASANAELLVEDVPLRPPAEATLVLFPTGRDGPALVKRIAALAGQDEMGLIWRVVLRDA